jgi:hypothetical protein
MDVSRAFDSEAHDLLDLSQQPRWQRSNGNAESTSLMIRIAITQAAFDAMPLGTMGYEPQTNAKGERDYLAAA